MEPRTEILRLQKKLYQENHEKIAAAAEVLDKEFRRYERRYLQAVKSYRKIAYVPEVEDAMRRANIVLVGDYHTLDQSQRSFIRVLRSYLKTQEKDVVVVLEAIQARHQGVLDRFLSGTLDDRDFLKKIGFKKHWFFDLWENYRVIFDFLKYHEIPVYGLDVSGTTRKGLSERDAFMARRLSALAKANPNAQIFALVGDLHLAPPHLPKAIKAAARADNHNLRIVTLYQNSPEIYWKLWKKSAIDHALVVRLSEDVFCRMHTPPVIAQQSYLNWLYQEDSGFDWVDAKGSFLDLVRQVARILDITLSAKADEVEVYTCGDFGFLKSLAAKKILKPNELKALKTRVLKAQSLFIPQAKAVYLANVSINRAAEEAGRYLRYLLVGEEGSRSRKDAFYAEILQRALGFFGSKLINAKRKCARTQDFQHELQYLRSANLIRERVLDYHVAELYLLSRERLRRGNLLPDGRIATFNPNLAHATARAIGYDLGDHLYYAFIAGHISRSLVREFFYDEWSGPGVAQQTFLDLYAALQSFKRPAKEL